MEIIRFRLTCLCPWRRPKPCAVKRLVAIAALTAVLSPAGVRGQAVDVHSHIILPEYVSMVEAHGAAMEEGFPLPQWDAAAHVAFMDSAGIGTSVLTLPAPQPYFGDAGESALSLVCHSYCIFSFFFSMEWRFYHITFFKPSYFCPITCTCIRLNANLFTFFSFRRI